MSMLSVHRSTEPKQDKTSSLLTEDVKFDKNIVNCLYNLMTSLSHQKTLTPELVREHLQLVFDIDVIENQMEKLSESILGQCVQQVHVQVEANTLKSVICKYIYGSNVAANTVKPGTMVAKVSYYELVMKLTMNALLQIQSQVDKKLIHYLSSVYEEILRAGDISSIKNTNVAKQNTLANYYDHIDYQNKSKLRGMNAGLTYRLIEEMWDRSPPLSSLPTSIKDYSAHNFGSLLSHLLSATRKFTFALNKYSDKVKENEILSEVANCWRLNTDNSLSPKNCEANLEIIGENIPISGVVILTDNLKTKLNKHIFTRSCKMKNDIVVCDVKTEDFHPQKSFITNGTIKMESTNLFVKTEKLADSENQTRNVEFLNMGPQTFAIHVLNPAFYQGDTTAKDRFKENVSVDLMMPLAIQFNGHVLDDVFKRDDSNAFVIPTRIYFKDSNGVTKHIGVDRMIPYVTGMLSDLSDFHKSVNNALTRLSKVFKISQIVKGKKSDFIDEQKVRTLQHMDDTFPFHYHLPVSSSKHVNQSIDETMDDVCQKPLWIMIGGLTSDVVISNIITLWTDHGYSDSIFDTRKIGRHSLSFARRRNVTGPKEEAKRCMIHALQYVRKNNPKLYPWIADHGKQLKRLLVDTLKFPAKIEHYVEFVIYMLNTENLYKKLFANGNFHLGLGFVLNRVEQFETESMLLSRFQGYKLFYSETTTEGVNDCQSPNYNFVTSMQTGHMPSSLTYPCIRYPHCILTDCGTMGAELIDADYMFDKRKPTPNFDKQVWIPIFAPCEMNESMFEDSFNPYGRSNISFDANTLDYLMPDQVEDPLSGLSGYNSMSLGLLNMNFVFHSRLLTSPAGFSMKKHIIPNRYVNCWCNEFQRNTTVHNNKTMMRNLQENLISTSQTSLHCDDLSQFLGGSTCKFCYTHPKMVKTLMSERNNKVIPGRNVYRQHKDFILTGSKLMECLDTGVNANDRFSLL